MDNKKIVKPLIISVLFIATYFPTLIWMWDRWEAKDSYYGHGILVPLISGFIVWQSLKKLKLQYKPSNLGLILIGVGLVIHLLSAWMRVYFSSGLSMLITLAGIALYFGGKTTLKPLAFPISFLLFMVPLPLVAIANISFKMKIFAAHMSTFIVNKMGIPAVRTGSLIHMRHANLMVEDPCSGLRSLIALLALGSLFAYYLKGSKIKKGIMLIASVPLALASNITRIVFLCFVSEVYGPQYAKGFIHDAAGMMVFVVAFIGMVIVSRILE
ncbi:MAG: exosortase/archaeosortase family protein [Candidatus Omnitrophota bacterium]|nr:exosortase/archaeosortase family protein [Candidatus Omnitrophota bacterium]